MADPPTDPIGTLPAPQELRERLGRALREAEVLKRMLKVAEFAEKQLKPGHGNIEVQDDSEAHL